jgi:hypothetical protein
MDKSNNNILKQINCVIVLKKFKYIEIMSSPVQTFAIFILIILGLAILTVSNQIIIIAITIVIVYLIFFALYGFFHSFFPIKIRPFEKGIFKKNLFLLEELIKDKKILDQTEQKILLVKIFNIQHKLIDNFTFPEHNLPKEYNKYLEKFSKSWFNLHLSINWLISLGDSNTVQKTIEEVIVLYKKFNKFDFKPKGFDLLNFKKDVDNASEKFKKAVNEYSALLDAKVPEYQKENNETLIVKLKKYKKEFPWVIGLVMLIVLLYLHIVPTEFYQLSSNGFVVGVIAVILFLIPSEKTKQLLILLKLVN